MFFTKNVLAQQANTLSIPTGGQVNESLTKIVPIRFLPNQPFYFVISFKEMVSRFFKPSAVRRADYDLTLSSKRLKESYLMYTQGDYMSANKGLDNYSKKVESLIVQIEKARSQNQELAMFEQKIIDELGKQEVLLRDLKIKEKINSNLDSLDNAIAAFSKLLKEADELKPGINNDYPLLKETGHSQESTSSGGLNYLDNNESSSSVKPRRIIY